MNIENGSNLFYLDKNINNKKIIVNNKLQDYINYITKSLNNIDEMIGEAHEYFDGDLAGVFYSKCFQYQNFFKLIVENLETYRTELLGEVKTKEEKWLCLKN